MNDDLCLNDVDIVGSIRLSSRAEVLSAWFYLPVVLKEFAESVDEFFFRVFLVVGLFADGKLNIKVGVAGSGSWAKSDRVLMDHRFIINDNSVLFLLHYIYNRVNANCI